MEPTPEAGTQTQPVEQKDVESPLVVTPPVALVITFLGKKHNNLLKRISAWNWDDTGKWGCYMKGLDNLEFQNLKMDIPLGRQLVGLAGGRVVWYWSNLTRDSDEVVQRFVHDLNTSELKSSAERLRIHSIVLYRKPSIAINEKPFTSTILGQEEILTPEWCTPLTVGIGAPPREISTPTTQKAYPPKASATKRSSKTQAKTKTSSMKRAGEPLEEPPTKRVALDIAPATASTRNFTEFYNKNLQRIKALEYRSKTVLEQILQAVKGKLGTLSYPAVLSTLQAKDSSLFKLSLSLLEVLDVHHSLLLTLSRNGSSVNGMPLPTAPARSNLPDTVSIGKTTGKQHRDTEVAPRLCGIYPSILQSLEKQGSIQTQVEESLQSISSSASAQASGIEGPDSHSGTKEDIPKKSIQALKVQLDTDVIQERLQWIDYQRDYWKRVCSTNDVHSCANPFQSTLRNFKREAHALVSLLEMVLNKGSGGSSKGDDRTSIENSQPNRTSDSIENISSSQSPTAGVDHEKLRELGDRLTQAQAELEEANRLRSVAEDEVRRVKQEKKLLEGQLAKSLSAKRDATTALRTELTRRIQAEQTVKSLLDSVIDVENALGYNTLISKTMPETLRPTATLQAL